ncbi:MAG: toprim domain-containing protein [Candidatus Obscuribacterales bacterium]|jgi:hypothetical protein
MASLSDNQVANEPPCAIIAPFVNSKAPQYIDHMFLSVSSVDFLKTLFEKLDGRKSGDNYLCFCPVHNGSQRNLSLKLGSNGKILAHCFAGCDYREIWNELRNLNNGAVVVTGQYPQAAIESRAWASRLIDKVWNESTPIKFNSPAWNYLTKRIGSGIDAASIKNLREHHSQPYKDERGELVGNFPCLIAPIRNVAGELITLHRTYLTEDGNKAAVSIPKKMMPCEKFGSSKGAAIQLAPPNDILCLTEGLETALAVNKLVNQPVWSCVSAIGLEHVIVPLGVKQVWIFADNDRLKKMTGEIAAKRLAERLSIEGKIVKVFMPSVAGTDFADVLINGGVQ